MGRNDKATHERLLRAIPWYDNLEGDHPFNLEVKVSGTLDCSTPFRAASIFPWNISSLDKLWNGEFAAEPLKVAQWRNVHDKWSGMVAVGGGSKLRLFLSRPHQQYLPIYTIDVRDMRIRFGDEEKRETADITCVTWCMVQNADEFWPLVAFSANAILYLLNVGKGTYHGVLRGHGGKIISLAVHPIDPCVLASTSYDNTCRIYDLTKRVECKLDNPHWPGRPKMALTGAPFGLRSNEPEGVDYGRCTAILAGGPSGGHLAPVLGAAFHPKYPVVATCGMDRAVKLWRLPVSTGERIAREDKPLFSSTDIHDAQVLTITWMSDDKLLTNCGKVIMRTEEKGPIYTEPGTLVLWRWLGLERFFPPGRETWPAVLRGCPSDYQGSSSYKILAKYSLPPPHLPTHAFVFESPAHTPLIVLPSLGYVYLSSVRHFEPHKMDDLTAATDNLRLDSDHRRNANEIRELPCWIVSATTKSSIDNGRDHDEEDKGDSLPKLEACVIAENGRLLIAVGEKEGIWIWRIPRGKQVV